MEILAANGSVLQLERGVSWRADSLEMYRVLVVGKELTEASLVMSLRRRGHDVTTVHTGNDAIVSHDDHDMVLLDLELPDLDGLDVCRAIRRRSDVALIALTAQPSELDCVLGLQAGADDFVGKPYGDRELLARIEAVMRRARSRMVAADVVSHGLLRIDPSTREVSVARSVVEVTRKEFDLLYILASNPGKIIPRKQLIQQVWGDSWSRRTIDTHISSLRAKLGASSWIITVRGIGFRIGRG